MSYSGVTEGSGDGEFYMPGGVAVDGSGNVYVSDFGSDSIHKFSSSGRFLAKWGTYCSGDGQFIEPQGVAVDGSGNVYVADYGNHRIQKFSSSGRFLAKWGTYGSGDGQFIEPQGVAVDGSGNVYVSDIFKNRIQKFAATTRPTHTPYPTYTRVPPPTTTPRPTIDLGAACKVEWRDALDYARVMGTLYPPSCTLPCEYRVEYADLMGYWINDCAR